MPSEHPASSVRSLTPVELALLEAALQAGCGPNPRFLDEIDWRLNRATRAMQGMADLFSAAGFHGFEVPADALYGMADLILNELKTVRILSERRDDIAPRTAREVAP